MFTVLLLNFAIISFYIDCSCCHYCCVIGAEAVSTIGTGMDAIIAEVGTERTGIMIVTEIMIDGGGEPEVVLVNALDMTERETTHRNATIEIMVTGVCVCVCVCECVCVCVCVCFVCVSACTCTAKEILKNF